MNEFSGNRIKDTALAKTRMLMSDWRGYELVKDYDSVGKALKR